MVLKLGGKSPLGDVHPVCKKKGLRGTVNWLKDKDVTEVQKVITINHNKNWGETLTST